MKKRILLTAVILFMTASLFSKDVKLFQLGTDKDLVDFYIKNENLDIVKEEEKEGALIYTCNENPENPLYYYDFEVYSITYIFNNNSLAHIGFTFGPYRDNEEVRGAWAALVLEEIKNRGLTIYYEAKGDIDSYEGKKKNSNIKYSYQEYSLSGRIVFGFNYYITSLKDF